MARQKTPSYIWKWVVPVIVVVGIVSMLWIQRQNIMMGIWPDFWPEPYDVGHACGEPKSGPPKMRPSTFGQ